MKPRKKGQQYEICYRCPGYQKPFYERFPTYEEASYRIAQIEFERKTGKFHPPKPLPKEIERQSTKAVTVAKLLDDYVQIYGLNHWGDSYLSMSVHRIEHYIKPYMGEVVVRDLTTRDLDIFYDSLQEKPAIVLKGHKKLDAKVSPNVIAKIHDLLRSALNQAVVWGYISVNPANHATLPKHTSSDRAVWTTAEAQMAVDRCKDPILRTAILLALGCSMRVGEILGLTWDCVEMSDSSIESGDSHLTVNKEIKRCQKDSLEKLEARGRSSVILKFPDMKKAPSSTALVLKEPKTESSIRMIYLPKTVALALQEIKKAQDDVKNLMGAAYTDYNLVIAHQDGRPYEERQIAEALRKFIEETGLPKVVFHSLRHCSASLKLAISGGNIKAVQGDTGHAQARMVTDLYAHTNNDERKMLAQKVERDFFGKSSQKQSQSNQAPDIDQALELMKKNPALAKLLVAALQGQTSSAGSE